MDKRFFDSAKQDNSILAAVFSKPFTSYQHILDRYILLTSELAASKQAADQNDTQLQRKHIKQAVDLLTEVRYSAQSDVTDHLPYDIDRLYDHMQQRLLESYQLNTSDGVGEVIEIIAVLQTGLETVSKSFFDKL